MAFHKNHGQRKLLIIGVDGATWDIIDPLIEAGELPNLRILIEKGSKTKLLSTVPPMSPQAWTSFHTGVNPWKHGISDFLSLDIGRPFSPFRWDDIRFVSIVELLDRAGIRTIWNNLPCTFPFPKLRNGIIVAGRLNPRGNVIYPEHLQQLVQQLFPQDYEIHIDLSSWAVDGKVSEMTVFSNLLVHTDHPTRLTERLMKTSTWDLCFVMFDATDIGQHIFWRYLDDKHPTHEPNAPNVLKQAIPAIYRKVDESIGALLDAAPKETNVIVLSDHGFGPLLGTVNLNGFLVGAGYTVPMCPTCRTNCHHSGRVVHWISSKLAQFQRNPQKPMPIFKSMKIDWKKTTVYAHGYMGNLFVNLKGREPKGRISRKDYEKVLQGVIKDLLGWKNPVTDGPMVRVVHRSPVPLAEQWRLPGVPDLVIEWFDYAYAGIHPGSFEQDFEAGCPPFAYNLLRSADHTLDGILICTGAHFEPSWSNAEIHEVSIYDIPPLIMTLMGLSPPDHFDGTTPKGLLSSKIDTKKTRSKQSEHRDDSCDQTDYTPDELSEISDRLKALGYLE